MPRRVVDLFACWREGSLVVPSCCNVEVGPVLLNVVHLEK